MNDKEQQFAFIHAYAEQYPISILAEIANVSRAGYYKWLKRNGEKHRDQIDERLIINVNTRMYIFDCIRMYKITRFPSLNDPLIYKNPL